jgi:hypothetical protein
MFNPSQCSYKSAIPAKVSGDVGRKKKMSSRGHLLSLANLNTCRGACTNSAVNVDHTEAFAFR